MKNQALFSSKDKSKKLKCRLLQLLFGALRANTFVYMDLHNFACRFSQVFHCFTKDCLPRRNTIKTKLIQCLFNEEIMVQS